MKPGLQTYRLRWAPTAQVIAVVKANSARGAVKKAPPPYRKYLGEVYAEQIEDKP